MLVLPADAKINLGLDVVARRDDGWHDIDTVMLPIDWHDLVGVTIGGAEQVAARVRVSGPAAAGVPTGAANVAVRASQLVLQAAGVRRHLSIWLDKRVPHAAGLGGGSADAAAALRACATLLAPEGAPIDEDVLAEVAGSVGSDVPAALAGRPVRVGGRGERVVPISAPGLEIAVAFVAPSATAAAYAAVTAAEMGSSGRIERLTAALHAGHRPDDGLLGSALEAAACRATPDLGAALARARQAVPERRWHLTGSGGALFAIADDRDAAEALALRMRSAGYLARACRTRAAR